LRRDIVPIATRHFGTRTARSGVTFPAAPGDLGSMPSPEAREETSTPNTPSPTAADGSTTAVAQAQEPASNGLPPVSRKRGARRKETAEESINLRPDLFDEEEYSHEEYSELLDLYEESISNISEGEIVPGKVLRVDENFVILDVGFKSEGAVPIDEFKDPHLLQPGDQVEVYLDNLEDQEGTVVLSKKKADFFRVWDRIRHAYENDEMVRGTLVRKIKGGVMVDLLGVDAFLPGSQIALRRVPNIDELIGQEMEFKIIKLNKRRRNIVVSRRVILERLREKKRETLLKEIAIGQVRKGVVKNITDFGAFIDLGGADGLLHITDMSWGRVSHPSEMLKIGDEAEVKILDMDLNNNRISLGLKQLQPYPWENVAEKYKVGQRVKGKVVSITNYGAFVELEKGVEGLVHISEMSWTRHIKHPSKVVSIGDIIECVVLNVNTEEEKISLGMKQIEADPWASLAEKYPPGTRLPGKVRNLTSFGAFVEIEEGIDGLVHISDMSWTRRVHHPSEIVKKGDTVDVQVLNIDVENKRISLGMKQLQEDPWGRLGEKYEVGTNVIGQVVRILDKGLVVDLEGEVEGFVPVSQLGVKNAGHPGEYVQEGDRLQMRVIESDPENRRIVLSVTESLKPRPRPAKSEEGAGEASPTEPEPAPEPAASE
jgi:small subunit ribosomal protein S1